jgi:hypothetical protein
MKIIIKDEFSNDYISRQAGERLRMMINNCLAKKEKCELDFKNMKVASVSFFDEAIAKLSENTQKDQSPSSLSPLIIFIDLYEMDKNLLLQLCEGRGLSIDLTHFAQS